VQRISARDFIISGSFSALARFSSVAHKAASEERASCKMILLAKLDRLAIGTILRSKLVFLIIVRLQIAFIEGACRKVILQTTFCRVCGH
jgi:hypothetical protein